ncbi:hypothetical protein [Nonomuraea sp. B1E8]|uniref:hypothetical protein n=1 Tax=Nonomuraea sp. B1E8 TaxID=3153575 RepID=UPI00325FCD51
MPFLECLATAPGGRQILLDDVHRRVLYHNTRMADPHEPASAQPGDPVRLVPGSGVEEPADSRYR